MLFLYCLIAQRKHTHHETAQVDWLGLKHLHFVQTKHSVPRKVLLNFPSWFNLTDKRKNPQEAKSAWENSSLGFIEAAYGWL